MDPEADTAAGPNEVVGGGKIIGGIRHDAAPSIVPRPEFEGAHQPQLQGVSAVFFQDTYPAEISRIDRSRRRDDAGKADRNRIVKGDPPVPLIELRNGSTVKECQLMKLGECVGNLVVMAVNLAYPVHGVPTLVP